MRTAPRTRRIRVMKRLAGSAYVLGLASGCSMGWEGGSAETCNIYWRGKRCYFLGWPRWKWRCVLKRHHWPTSQTVVFDLCGKCCPWPCCGAITHEHAAGCDER